MKNRRSFLRRIAIASSGAILIPGVAFSKSRTVTTSKNIALIKSSNKVDLRTFGSTNKYIVVKGKVYDKSGLALLPGATVEVFKPSSGLLKPMRSSKVTANEKGEYQFLMDYPEKEVGKSPRIHLKVANGNNAYSTELIVTNFDAHISDKHWELNNQLGDKLFPQKVTFANHAEVLFNLSV